MENEIWINMLTAPREQVQKVFEHQRDKLFREYAQMQIEIESANENRFADEPIKLDMNFLAQYAIFKMLPREKQNEYLAPLFED